MRFLCLFLEEEVRAFFTERNSNSIDYFRNRLCRVFNENFSRGGRFYQGWWQGIPSELRCYITIDGEPTSELDYSGQHLLLLYALKGEEQLWLRGKGDSYLIEGYGKELRDLMKQAFLICVNEASRDKAIQAIRQEINYNYKKVSSTNAFINPLIDAIMAKHPELSDCFFSGMWGELQYQDSQIAEYVLSHMQAWKQLVLPVHDSFVVRRQTHRSALLHHEGGLPELGNRLYSRCKTEVGCQCGYEESWLYRTLETDGSGARQE